jgi:MFS family permease
MPVTPNLKIPERKIFKAETRVTLNTHGHMSGDLHGAPDGETRLKHIAAVVAINYFVSGALTLIIPLLLLERKMNLAEVGAVLSVLPLVFLTARLLLAVVADRFGWASMFTLVNWPSTFVSTLLYYTAASVPAFLLGKIVEGLKESSFWAVNRTAVFALAPDQRERRATWVNGVIWLATAVGSAFAGVSLAFWGFTFTMGILLLACAVMGIPTMLLWRNAKRAGTNLTLKQTSTMQYRRARGRFFWLASLALTLYSLSTYPLTTLLLPAFMATQIGYDYISIGVVYMLYNLCAALVTLKTLKHPTSDKRAFIQSAVGFSASALLAYAGFFFPALVMAVAATRGLSIAFFELIIVKATRDSASVSFDIGLLHVPMRFAEFGSVLGAGVLAEAFGYTPLFIASGLTFAAFSWLSLRITRMEQPADCT